MNTFNVTYKNASKAVVIFFVVVILAWLIAGCGNDDNPTGNNGNPPAVNNDSLLFSVDSFTVYSSHAPRYRDIEYNDTTTQSRNYKVVCNVVSNVPVSNDTCYFKYICLPYPNGNIVWLESRNNETQSINLNYTFSEDSTSGYHHIRHYISAGFYNSYPANLDHYITVKNFHLYLVK